MFTLNTLTFTYTFEYDNDTIFFSYFQPYTLTDLKDYLFMMNKTLKEDFIKNNLKVQKLCDTVDKNPCLLLTISENVNEQNLQK